MWPLFGALGFGDQRTIHHLSGEAAQGSLTAKPRMINDKHIFGECLAAPWMDNRSSVMSVWMAVNGFQVPHLVCWLRKANIRVAGLIRPMGHSGYGGDVSGAAGGQTQTWRQ